MCGWTGHIQDSEAELLPAAETSEAELGQPSKFTSALRRAMEIWATATIFTSALRRAMEIWATATIGAESVRGRKAECAVQRSILSPGGSRAKRVQWTKQRRRGWRSAPVFASAHRDAPRKSAKRKRVRGKEFLSRVCGQKWVPTGAWRFCDTLAGACARVRLLRRRTASG